MDVQKTMEFILRHQAKAEGEMAAMRQRQAESEAKAERQMAAIRKLIHTGMRMIVKNDELIKEVAAAQRETATELRELAAAQKVTETELRGLIVALRRGGNGSHRKN
jgi:glutamine synthetase